MTMGLEDKVVLITGAGSGIGAAVARGFAAQGAKVAVHYHRSVEGAEGVVAEARSLGVEAVMVRGDLREPDEAESVAAQVRDIFGGIDVLINNAGALVRRVAWPQVDGAIFQEVIDVNCKSAVMMSTAAIPLMRGGGSIINVSSVAARFGGAGGAGLYASSKGFILTYTRSLARELARQNIRVNQVAPGLIRTPFHEGITSADQFEALEATIPMGRAGTAQECVGAFLFFASEEMSGYVTGQTIDINGGQLMP